MGWFSKQDANFHLSPVLPNESQGLRVTAWLGVVHGEDLAYGRNPCGLCGLGVREGVE